jgi:hypothetical protein
MQKKTKMMVQATHTLVNGKSSCSPKGVCELLWQPNTAFCYSVQSGSPRYFLWMGAWWRRTTDVASMGFFLLLPLFSLFSLEMSHVCGVATIVLHTQLCVCIWKIWGDKEFLSFISGKKWNGSRHLVLWLLGTLTGLRDRVRRLVV